MGRIRLTGATSGYTELRAANAAGNNTITLPTTNGGEVIVSDSSGNVNIDSGTFYVDATNNRVGLGVSNPTYLFDARGGRGLFSANSESFSVGVRYSSALAPNGNYWLGATNSVSPDLLFSNNAGDTRMVLTDTGRLGVGTTSPSHDIDLRKDAPGSTVTLRVRNDNVAADSNSALTLDTPNGVWGLRALRSGARLAVDIGGSEKAAIDQNGRLLVGTSSSLDSSSGIQNYVASGQAKILNRADSLVNGQVSSFQTLGYANAGQPRYGELGLYKHSGITNACAFLSLNSEDAAFNYLWTDNSDVLRISTNADHIGTTSGTVVGTQTSDERLKNILGPVEYGLNTLKQIEPVRYSLKSQPETEQLGFIAQQVQPLVPQSVFDTKEHIEGEPEDAPTKLGMEYVALIPVLVNAIKELSAEVDVLKAQLQAQ